MKQIALVVFLLAFAITAHASPTQIDWTGVFLQPLAPAQRSAEFRVHTITATALTGTSTFPNASTTNLRINGQLLAGSNSGTNGQVLQNTGSGIQWTSTSSLGITGGGGGSGTVTSVGLIVPTGLSVTNSPVTSAATMTIAYGAGYGPVLTASSTQFKQAFDWGDHSLVGYLTNASIDTSAELAAILTNETGSGNVVFSANPTFTGTQTLSNFFASTATITSATTSNLSISGTLRGAILPNCSNGTTDKLTYSATTGLFTCSTDQTSGGGSGITSLNGDTAASQTFASSTSGTDFSITTSGSVHTWTLPSATSTARGLLTANDWLIFNNKLAASSIDTSAELIAILTDETGTGSAVFNTAPAFGGTSTFNGITATGITATGITATGTFTIGGALVDSAGTAGTLGQLLQATGSSTRWVSTSTLGISGSSHDAVTLAGEDYLSLSTQQITANAIDPDNLSASDFGSFTCNGTTCTVDNTAITNAMLANSTVSYGGVTLSLGGTDATPAFDLADATGLPIATGVSGLGTGIATWLATPSSANLDTAVTDDTGSGALVFGTSPSIASPTLTSFFGTPCTGNEFLQDISDTGAFTCVAASGGGGGSGAGWATTTDGSVQVTYTSPNNPLYAGGSASNTAELIFDYRTSVLSIASSSDTATATFASTNRAASLSFGIASSSNGVVGSLTRGFNISYVSSAQAVVTAIGGVTTWAWTNFDMIYNSVTALGGTFTDFLRLPNGSNPTVDAAGECAWDTTDDQLKCADSGNTARVVAHDEFRVLSVTIASTSASFASGGLLPALSHKDGLEITQFRCWVSGGTSKVLNLTDGTNDTESITCGTSVTSDTDVATNDTFTADEAGSIEFGATTGSVNYVHVEVWGRITVE